MYKEIHGNFVRPRKPKNFMYTSLVRFWLGLESRENFVMPTQCARHLFIRVYWTSLGKLGERITALVPHILNSLVFRSYMNSLNITVSQIIKSNHKKIMTNFYMWLLYQRSETHQSTLHFLLFLVEFSNDTSKLSILPMRQFLFSLVF